jgi:hypothetical protein
MSKSIKLKNDNYIDSTGIVDNKISLKTRLEATPLWFDVRRNGNNYLWAKIATLTTNKGAWVERNLVLLLKGTHNSNSDRVALINISLATDDLGAVSKFICEAFAGTSSFKVTDVYLEHNDDVTSNLWLRIETNIYAHWQVVVLSNNNNGWIVDVKEKVTSTNNLPTTGYTGINPTKTY